MEQNNTAKEITFGDLCRLFAKKWVLFLVVAIVVGSIGGVYGQYRIKFEAQFALRTLDGEVIPGEDTLRVATAPK